MPIIKTEVFARQDVYFEDAYEEVMFRWDHVGKSVYRRFYGDAAESGPIDQDGDVLNEALLNGKEITQAEYDTGRPKR